jgi:hypothetical protein
LGRKEGDLSISGVLYNDGKEIKNQNSEIKENENENANAVCITENGEEKENQFLNRKMHRDDPEIEEKRKKLLEELNYF